MTKQDILNEFIGKYQSAYAAAKASGMKPSTLNRILNHERRIGIASARIIAADLSGDHEKQLKIISILLDC